MASKQISDEKLNIDVVINGDPARQELLKLEQAQKKLKENGDALTKTKMDLIKAGKKESEGYKNIVKEITANNKAIEANRAAQKAQRNAIDLTKLTMRELAKESRSLKALLSSAVPDSTEWNVYKRQLQDVEGQQRKLRSDIRGTTKAMGDSAKNWLATAFGVGVFIEAGREALHFAKQWISDARQMAVEAKGVEFAYKRLGKQGEDAFLRIKTATRGLMADLDVKRSIVEFDNFGLSLDRINSLMEFASVRAAQTGKSFDYMLNSLVEGLSKKSALRIDNLGISAAALNQELEKTPDFVEAVANIAERDIAKAGNILDEAASSSAQWDATLANLQLRFGKLFNDSGFIQNLQHAGAKLFEMITPTKSVTEQLEDQTQKVLNLNNRLTPLVDEYDNLKNKSELTTDEQTRLSEIIQEIAKITPSAITAFDEYGNALDVSSEKARDFIKTQQALLQFRNQDALKEQTAQLEEYRKAAERAQTALSKRDTQGDVVVTKSTSVGTGGASTVTRKATDEEIAALQNQLAKYQQMISGAEASIEELSGDYLNKYLERQKKQTQTALEEAQKRADALGVEYSPEATAGQIEAAIKQWESLSGERQKEAERRIEEAKRTEQQRLEAIKNLEDQYLKEKEDRLAVSNEAQAKLNQKRALKEAEDLKAGQELLDQIRAEHKIKIDEAKDKDEEIELQRIKDFEDRKRELENEIALSKAETDQEKEMLQLEQKNEAEQLKLEQDLERLQLNEEQKTELLKLLTDAQNAAIFEIEEKWRGKKQKSEEDLVKERKRLLNESLDAAINAAGQETKLGQALLAVKQILALKESAIEFAKFNQKMALQQAETTGHIATGFAATAAIGFPQNVPLIIGFVAQVAGLISTIKNVASKGKKNKTLQGFEDGLYPVTRTDGKQFKARYGGGTKTQVVKQPTYFSDYLTGEAGPELIVDSNTFKRLDPAIINHILSVRNGMRGFETGYTSNAATQSVPTLDPIAQQEQNRLLSEQNQLYMALLQKMDTPFKAYSAFGYEEIEKINLLIAEAEKSKQNGTLA
ncbi:hypothetical protein ACH3O9_11425 [Leeuwenhoekiella sp. A16]|uniref:hypothetical protein n=1 Tax=Leeuwenhoekiella sp. A16 TaxID=3141462 RepID=UPI003A80EE2E